MQFGAGKYTYELVEGWGRLPAGWSFGWIPAVACDSKDNVYVYSRSEHPLVIFDRDGNFLDSWGEDVLQDAHGIFIDAEDNVFCTERNTHCVRKFDKHGKLLLTIGTPGQPGPNPGDPFNLPTDLAVAPDGSLYISDGYGNARVHHYSAGGQLLKSWGEPGDGPGQFDLSHCVRIDRHNRLWVCDRNNARIQLFDLAGNYLDQWPGLAHPDQVFFDAHEDVVYMAELDQQVSIYTFDRQLLAQWGGRVRRDEPGHFGGCPHGVWVDSRGDLYISEVQIDARLHKYARV
ncbi:MAG: peptidyl-alpha-hydroxyglycine alpha-amidating lyase family protein [Caldilineaceae bacterium]|nr:peptidyl-alpha-hydroxyglycine alpha-amidating lyase family protein [Caldilineaceae bacterium]